MFEKIFSTSSYGYRPNRNAYQALESVRNNCRKYDWVIDLDLKGFFDNIDQGKLLLALEKHVTESWCMMYIKRWLTAPETILKVFRALDAKIHFNVELLKNQAS